MTLTLLEKQIKNTQQNLRRALRPELSVANAAYKSIYYWSNRKREIAKSAKWNKDNKERRNERRRLNYAKM